MEPHVVFCDGDPYVEDIFVWRHYRLSDRSRQTRALVGHGGYLRDGHEPLDVSADRRAAPDSPLGLVHGL